MSETYALCCTTCKESLWIGQGHDNDWYVYSTPEQMALLNEFCNRHLSHYESNYFEDETTHKLQILNSQAVPEDYMEDQRTYNHSHRKRWCFRHKFSGENQTLEEFQGGCVTDFYTYLHKEMLHVVEDMAKNDWRLEYVIEVE